MFLRKLIFIALLFVPCVAHAGIGEHDDRVYVDWNQAPYDKIVYVQDMGAGCTGQYVAPDIILTANHCFNGGYGATGNEGMVVDITVSDGRKTQAILERVGKNMVGSDWALLRLSDSSFFRQDYFDLDSEKIENFPVSVQNAGFGWLRILSDDEIDKIRNYFYETLNTTQPTDLSQYLQNKSAEIAKLLGNKSLHDLDSNNMYKLKAHKSCQITGVQSTSFYDTGKTIVKNGQVAHEYASVKLYHVNCDTIQGNSGGAIIGTGNSNTLLKAIVSRSSVAFENYDVVGDADDTWVLGTPEYLQALNEMKKTSPTASELSDIISGRKAWNPTIKINNQTASSNMIGVASARAGDTGTGSGAKIMFVPTPELPDLSENLEGIPDLTDIDEIPADYIDTSYDLSGVKPMEVLRGKTDGGSCAKSTRIAGFVWGSGGYT